MRLLPFARWTPNLLLVALVSWSPVVRSAAAIAPVEIPAGLRLDQIGALLDKAGVTGAAGFLQKAVEPQFVRSLGVPGDSLEGFLCPGTYPLVPSTPPEVLLRLLVAACAPTAAALEQEQAAQPALDRLGRITLASIIEKETVRDSDRALLAAVLLNRLRRGWHLDCLSTAAHAWALSHPGFGGDLPRGAERLDHPYNTFVHPGLPPGPICSPSAASIQAVLHPAQSERLVVFRGPEGGLEFALDPAERAAIEAVRPDPPPVEITRGIHYLVSNEKRPYFFQSAIERLGGVWIGVGSEQNYTLGGWLRPDLLILLDFDQMIVDLHAVYRVAFLQADSPAKFIALWDRHNEKQLTELVRSAYSDDRRKQRAALWALRFARKKIKLRLDKILAAHAEAGRVSFLDDPEQYAHLRELFRTKRVLALRGDLTARRSLRDLGRVLAEHQRVVRALYLSNAEDYFDYGRDFRRNIRGLPIDDWSLILRTRPTGGDYTYILQWYRNFERWLQRPGVRNVRFLVPRRELSWRQPVFQVTAEPPAPPKRRPARARARQPVRRKS